MQKYIGMVAWIDEDGSLETWQISMLCVKYPSNEDIIHEFEYDYAKNNNGVKPTYEQISINVLSAALIADWYNNKGFVC